ncbi:MAG: right-handed parallel beta-helix repeat-containing protein, partial [Planctomycetota bacterium]
MTRASQIGFAVLLMMAGQALRDAWGWPPTEVEIVPATPTTADTVAITIRGGWGDTCVPNDSHVLVTGCDIYVDVMWDYDPFTMCAAIPMRWQRTESVGPLAAGTYDVYARLDGCPNLPDFPFCPVHDTEYALVAEFVVVQSIIYVDADASGANNGSSWTDALNYLQDALMIASEGDEIRVAQGFYRPDDFVLSLRPNLGRMETFQLKNGVAIKGGYAGFGEPDPNARDIEMYEAILSGDLNGDDGTGPHWDRLENSYHVVTTSGTDETAVLDGFTIAGGNADGPDPACNGGGMYNDAGMGTVINCTFRDNSATHGGGMYNCNTGNVTVTNCVFSGNSGHGGGGMYNRQSNPTLANCTFWQNEAWMGAGMYNHSGGAELSNCTFSANVAGMYGGGVSNCCGSSLTLTNCILWGDVPEEINEDGALVVTHRDVQGGWPGEGNIDADPCFSDPNHGDYHLRSQAGRWDPVSGSWVEDDVSSPCIDGGDP